MITINRKFSPLSLEINTEEDLSFLKAVLQKAYSFEGNRMAYFSKKDVSFLQEISSLMKKLT